MAVDGCAGLTLVPARFIVLTAGIAIDPLTRTRTAPITRAGHGASRCTGQTSCGDKPSKQAPRKRNGGKINTPGASATRLSWFGLVVAVPGAVFVSIPPSSLHQKEDQWN